MDIGRPPDVDMFWLGERVYSPTIQTTRSNIMFISTMKMVTFGAAIAVAAAGVSGFALGSAQLEQIGSLSNNEGIVVDLKTFKIKKGSASGDPASRLIMLNAKQVAAGAVVFRTGDSLYIIDTQPGETPPMMRGDWPPKTIDDFNSIFTTRMR
jgi:hypothetical protein